MILVTLQLLFRRLLLAIPILLCVSALVFVILRLLPADPVAMSLPPGATPADYQKLRQAFGLDRSLLEQYGIWLGRLLHGDLGGSIYFRRPVTELLASALPATLELVAASLVLGVVIGVGGGLAMFALRGRTGEHVLDAATTVMMAIPEFLWAILLILLVGVSLQWLPFIGRLGPGIQLPPHVTGFLLIDSLITGRFEVLRSALTHVGLPAVALAIGLAPLVMRCCALAAGDGGDDYGWQARRRGVSERRILMRHALPNAALPTLSLIGVQGGFMFGGTILVEMIFAYPGLAT